jgi:hemerythrin
MARFVKTEIPDGLRGSVRLAAKIEESCMEEAEASLTRAAEEHFALEEIYKQAMDFPALGRYTKKICAEITERLMK